MSKRDDILAALKSGCYLAQLANRLFLVDDRLPAYKRLVAIEILKNLLDAGLVRELETQPGVWLAN